MTSNLGIDWYTTSGNYAYKRNQWATQANRRTAAQANNNYNATTSPTTLNQTQTDVFSLSHTSGCTDGADDGKIGLFSAVGNVAKGVGKTVVNTAKGALGFKSDGTWSPLKLAKTIAIGAVCAAFPAAALVACGVGAVAGGAQIIKGVGNAMSATTDAEAKSAWQNVGAGAFTTAASVAGAKASYKGVMNGASKTANGSSLQKLAGEDGSTSLTSLIKEKGIAETAKALGEDMVSSTKYSGEKLFAAASERISSFRQKGETAKSDTLAEGAEGAPKAEGAKSETSKTEGLKEGTPKGETEKTGFLKNIGKKAQDLWDKTLGKNKTEAQAPAEQAGLVQKLQNMFVKDGKITFDYKALGSSINSHYQTILGKIAESGYGKAVQAYGYSQVQDALAAFAAVQTIDVDM